MIETRKEGGNSALCVDDEDGNDAEGMNMGESTRRQKPERSAARVDSASYTGKVGSSTRPQRPRKRRRGLFGKAKCALKNAHESCMQFFFGNRGLGFSDEN